MEPERQDYEGHRIELRAAEAGPEPLIDGVPVRYGRLPDGQFFLHEYAYDTSDDLMEVVRRFIAYRRRAAEARRPPEPGQAPEPAPERPSRGGKRGR